MDWSELTASSLRVLQPTLRRVGSPLCNLHLLLFGTCLVRRRGLREPSFWSDQRCCCIDELTPMLINQPAIETRFHGAIPEGEPSNSPAMRLRMQHRITETSSRRTRFRRNPIGTARSKNADFKTNAFVENLAAFAIFAVDLHPSMENSRHDRITRSLHSPHAPQNKNGALRMSQTIIRLFCLKSLKYNANRASEEGRKLKGIFFALALVLVPLHADTITVTSPFTGSALPNVRHVDINEFVSVQQFDPALGVLNSIDLSLYEDVALTWNIVTHPFVSLFSLGGFTDFGEDEHFNFLGVDMRYVDGLVFGGAPWFCNAPPSYPLPCPNQTVSLADSGPVSLAGNITDSTSTAHSDSHARGTISGAFTPDLSAFIGTSYAALPIGFSIDAFAQNNTLGMVIGDLIGSQVGYGSLTLKYNYTPTPIVESPVSAAPEPRYLWLLLATALLILIPQNILARHRK